MKKANIYNSFGGRDASSRDHHVSKATSISGSLDTPFAASAQGYSTTEGVYEKN